MDFFARQDEARRETHLLVGYFSVAVVLIVVSLNLVAVGIVNVSSAYQRMHSPQYDRDGRPVPQATGRTGLWQPDIFAFVTLGTLIVIGGGSLFKIAQLASGGKAVAELMGAAPVPANTTDPQQKVLRNIVEEMSIASGVPPPAVYVMPQEQGINAFAAGLTQRDAVICVTQGCLTRLNRDELQGVIAHEFSHVLNGDMRMDLKLVGALFGILLIGLIGYGMVRAAGSTNSRNSKDNNGALAVLVAGLAMMAIGSIGLFFGRLIQAAVCRQREILADASAVQFTRNPGGLAGALKKIGAIGAGSRIDDHAAEQIAHMFFASSMGADTDAFSTHPPLAQRIRALEPGWDGTFPRVEPSLAERYGGAQPDRTFAAAGIPMAAAAVVGSLGTPMPRHVQWASDFLTSIPPVIDQAAREPFSARALVFALLLSDEAVVRQKQMDLLTAATDATTLATVRNLAGPVAELGPRARRVLLDLALPALRHLSGPQCSQFGQAVEGLIDADGRVTLFEFMLHRILQKYLTGAAPAAEPQASYYAIKPLLPDIQTLLSALAAADEKDPTAVQSSFRAGVARLQTPEPLALQQPVSVKAIDAALDRLAQAAPGVKRRVVDACAYCVAADGMVQTEEGELLRAITTALDCPLPPLLAEHAGVPQPA